jgi:CRISPR-associated protein Csx14
MTTASIPVDLFNPGQVLASLGFLEAANVLCSSAAGGFDWTNAPNVRFVLRADGDRNPFERVLEFLSSAELRRIAPPGYKDPPQKETKRKKTAEGDEEADVRSDDLVHSDYFPAREADTLTLPLRLTCSGQCLNITHWADGSSRDDFKLYAGPRSAAQIARAMLVGTREKPRKGQKLGELKTKGIHTLWEKDPGVLVERPFDVLTPMGAASTSTRAVRGRRSTRDIHPMIRNTS